MNSTASAASVDHSISKLEDEPYLQALTISTLFSFPMILKAAVELDVLGIISRAGSAGVSAGDIASHIPTKDPDASRRVDRMLCLLAVNSILTCSLSENDERGVQRIYRLSPTGRYFVQQGDEGSAASMLALNAHPITMEVWSHAKDTILGGGNEFKKVHKKSAFHYTNIDPTYNQIFNQAMADLTTKVMNQVLQIYGGFERLGSLVDVAGGTGKCLAVITSKYPPIKGINFDVPHVVATAPFYPGIKHVGGDMFASVPKGEAIMIKDALHNWDDEHCIKVLKNCYESLPEKGKAIIINVLMPKAPDSTLASRYITQLDATMLIQLGSHERTQKQFEALCMASGFSEFWVADHLAYSVWAIMEFRK
ncbi:hypothetical protein CRG98_010049 [Punica granatum]|nr:hypothetical protein CRG98_010049 [Punica granatum]